MTVYLLKLYGHLIYCLIVGFGLTAGKCRLWAQGVGRQRWEVSLNWMVIKQGGSGQTMELNGGVERGGELRSHGPFLKRWFLRGAGCAKRRGLAPLRLAKRYCRLHFRAVSTKSPTMKKPTKVHAKWSQRKPQMVSKRTLRAPCIAENDSNL